MTMPITVSDGTDLSLEADLVDDGIVQSQHVNGRDALHQPDEVSQLAIGVEDVVAIVDYQQGGLQSRFNRRKPSKNPVIHYSAIPATHYHRDRSSTRN